MTPAALSGLDLLATAVMVVDRSGVIRYMNPSAENLFETSSTQASGLVLDQFFSDPAVLVDAIRYARAENCSYFEHDIPLSVDGRGKLHLSCMVTPIDTGGGQGDDGALLEFRHIDQQLKVAREERMLDQTQANRELVRNLAHEIKNPLGGIRGAAQLLDHELDRPALHEYTQVIMKEADRLQALMDRLLSPTRLPQPTLVNIHEVLERVRTIIMAEFPQGIVVLRDYDTSLPPVKGDREQLIQAFLNIARNAAQAHHSGGTSHAVRPEIRMRTRVARQITLLRRLHRLAIEIQIMDNGPGVPEGIRERIFYPLVSGRDGGSGLGLTLVQNFVAQHHGAITFDSVPGNTCFSVLLPVAEVQIGK